VAYRMEKFIPHSDIAHKVREIAKEISEDYQGKEPVLIGVLKGAVIFMSDLIRELNIPVEIDFMAVSSYGASTKTSGIVRILKDLDQSIKDRDVLIVEDIVDTGLTLQYLKETLVQRKPSSLKVVALLDKPYRRQVEVEADYRGFVIPDEFVVGYGLDFNERHRYLYDLYKLIWD